MKFKYSKDKDVIIKEHEEEMLKIYSNIVKSYRVKFAQYNCSLKLGCQWERKFNKYSFSICCRVCKDGNEFIADNGVTGEVDYHVLYASALISSIDSYVYLDSDTNEFIEDIESFLNIAEELHFNNSN